MTDDATAASMTAQAQADPAPAVPVAWGTRMGPDRPVNEDSLATGDDLAPEVLDRRGRLYVVSDGMGGHAAGEEASRMTVATVRAAYYGAPAGLPPDAALEAAIQAANSAVNQSARSGATEGMGATVVAAVVRGADVTLAHVGDSRAYLLRGRRVRQLTQDHTLVAELVRRGSLPPDRLATHPMRHALSQHIGQADPVRIDVGHLELQPTDRIVLTTDGVSDVLSHEALRRASGDRAPEAAIAAILDAVERSGQEDDATAVVIGPSLPTGGRRLPRGAWISAAAVAALAVVVGIVRLARNRPAEGPEAGSGSLVVATATADGAMMPPAATLTVVPLPIASETATAWSTAAAAGSDVIEPTSDAHQTLTSDGLCDAMTINHEGVQEKSLIEMDVDSSGRVNLQDWCVVNCPCSSVGDIAMTPTKRDRFNMLWRELCRNVPPPSDCSRCCQ